MFYYTTVKWKREIKCITHLRMIGELQFSNGYVWVLAVDGHRFDDERTALAFLVLLRPVLTIALDTVQRHK